MQLIVVPGDGLALVRMPDIKLLRIIRVVCETINKTADRTFDVQTRHLADS